MVAAEQMAVTVGMPLSGVKVADCSWFGAGPICGEHLATYGATVVRVESEAHLDGLRGVMPFAKDKQSLNVSGYFNNYNAGKLDLTLNLGTELGLQMARRLIAWCDVFLTNHTPRMIDRWGLSYDELRAINPEIIAVYQPMQGLEGPHKYFGGFGAVLNAVTGYNELSGFPNRPPMGLGTNYPDYVINPGHTLIAILAALRHKRRTGNGQLVELAQVESVVATLAPVVMDYVANGRVQTRAGNRVPNAAPHGAFRCKDGEHNGQPEERWVALGVFDDAQWRGLAMAMGSPAWAADERFATHDARKQHEDELEAKITEWTRERTAEAAMAALQAQGVPAGVVQNARDVLDADEHMRERGYYAYLDHPEAGRTAYDGPPFRLSKTPGVLRSPAPCLGEHNEYVCKEILGMSDEEIGEALAALALY